jgi:hypothetical protein
MSTWKSIRLFHFSFPSTTCSLAGARARWLSLAALLLLTRVTRNCIGTQDSGAAGAMMDIDVDAETAHSRLVREVQQSQSAFVKEKLGFTVRDSLQRKNKRFSHSPARDSQPKTKRARTTVTAEQRYRDPPPSLVALESRGSSDSA